MSASESIPLILFSGLAADADVFVPQKLAFPQLIVPKWPKPEPEDSFDSYCDRIADELKVHESPILGGASFGGFIALHVAQRLDSAAVILIGSVRSPEELPRLIRSCRILKPLIPMVPIRFAQLLCIPFKWKLARRVLPRLSGLARQFHRSDPTVLKWSLARVLDWKATPKVACPIFQIHGDRDYVLPIRNTRPDKLVAGGGHVISLSHASEVNAFIESVIGEMQGEQWDRDRSIVSRDAS